MVDSQAYGWRSGNALSLHDKIRADLKTAMLGKDDSARDTLRQILSEFPNLTVPIVLESGKKTTRVKKPDEITDDDILDIIRKLVKSEKTVLEYKGSESSPYLALLEKYLPRMALESEIKDWVATNIDFAQFKNSMQAMGPVMKHFGKLADGNLVKKILQSL
ncbi:MAG: GatB/YqeY domain-containing protein [Desulfobacterales bacterium]|nr:GatB/YqeY domain-containing protein [Desulfobacterales bacterium]